ncbi:substrate-binding domain-containing protein [Ruegeria atlantica]|uniref:substrate-binding domain-containing protein n=1 Tax=Ruegeria atlantica TaxID=81569 RepID=UPI00147B54CD|nr:substrate-binding domain-containing protein [Ruegeria atlantica]
MLNKKMGMLLGGMLSLSVTGAWAETVGVAVPGLGHSYWISMLYGVEAEAEKSGTELVIVNAGGDANASTQIAQIQDLMQRQVSAILVGAADSEAIVPVVEQALAKGIPVVGLGSLPRTEKLSAAVTADFYDMGRLQAQCLGEAIGWKGKVAMMSGPAGQDWAVLRANGFKETIAANGTDVEIVAESNLADSRNSALTTMEDWLQRFSDIDGVYSATDDMAAGIILALEASGRTDIQVSASNFSPAAQEFVRNGRLVCTSIQAIVAQGSEALRLGVELARGNPVQSESAVPAMLINSANVDSIDLSQVVAPSDYRP